MGEVTQKYQAAKAAYEKVNVDTDAVLKQLAEVKISMHVWQGDDVKGFLSDDELSGGISVTGNYPGGARTPEELRSDLEEAYSLIPGKHKLNLHAIYLDTDEKVDLNELEPKDFEWVDWAKNQGLGLILIQPSSRYPMFKDGFTLASPDSAFANFGSNTGSVLVRSLNISGRKSVKICVNNFWVPDGYKDNPNSIVIHRENA